MYESEHKRLLRIEKCFAMLVRLVGTPEGRAALDKLSEDWALAPPLDEAAVRTITESYVDGLRTI